jgi:hypothetical protein
MKSIHYINSDIRCIVSKIIINPGNSQVWDRVKINLHHGRPEWGWMFSIWNFKTAEKGSYFENFEAERRVKPTFYSILEFAFGVDHKRFSHL